ncbi:PAS domain S-box protein [candidate division KSB1 bacterium]|nr:PAS domain S-box protein [candidate division KSB1 bacterium]
MNAEVKTESDLLLELKKLRRWSTQLEAENRRLKQTQPAMHEPIDAAYFQQIADNFECIFWISSIEMNKHYFISQAYETIFGRTSAAMYENPESWLDALHPDDRQRIIDIIQKYRLGEGFGSTEFRVLRPDGSMVWVRHQTTPIYDENRHIFRIAAITLDISRQKQAEKALENERNLLKTLFDTIPAAIYVKDTEGRFLMANNEVARRTGMSTPEEVVGKTDFDLHPPEFAKQYFDREQELFRTGKSIINSEQYMLNRATGNMIWNLATTVPLKSPDGKIAGLIGIGRDITENKLSAETLRISRHLLEQTFASLDDALFIIDAETIEIKECNRAAIAIFGYRREEMLGKTTAFLHIDEAALEEFRKHLNAAIQKQGFLRNFKFSMRRKDGSLFPTEHGVMPLENHLGERIGWVSVVRDITERVLAEKALRENEIRYRTLFENANDAIFIMKTDRFVECNAMTLKMFGAQNKEELIGHTACELSPEHQPDGSDSGKKCLQIIESVMKGEPQRFYWQCIRLDGVAFDTEISLNRFEIGNEILVQALARDITRQKQTENALAAERTLLRTVIDTIPDSIYAKDTNCNFILANKELARRLGVQKPEDLIGKNDFEFHASDLASTHHADEQKIISTGLPILNRELEIIERSTGEKTWILTNKVPLFDSIGKIVGLVGMGRNISARKRMENDLAQSEYQYREMINSMGDGIHLVDRNLKIILFNDALLQWHAELGLQSASVGEHLLDVYPFLKQNVLKEYEKVFETGIPLMSQEYIKLSDREIFTEIRKIPIFSGSKVIKMITVIRDITEQKKADEQIRLALREKEVLLKEIHHRVKNNMQVISSLLNLQADYIQDPQARDVFRECQSRIKSMALVHERLYQAQDLSRIDFSEYIRSLTNGLLRAYRLKAGDVAIKVDAESVLLPIDVSIPCGLIINELVTNALKYAFVEKQRGHIYVALRKFDENTIDLIVSDNGIGIPEGIDIRKTETLGLNLVTNLVEGQLRGSIQLDRSSGTSFLIKFKITP